MHRNTSSTGWLRLAIVLGILTASAACAKSPSAPSSPSGTDSVAGPSSSLQFCVDEVNRYRGIAGLPALARSADLDAFAEKAATYDAGVGVPHTFFLASNGGGVAKAETQLLLWKGYALDNVIKVGMKQMWDEGPSGPHYHVIVGNYSEIGCGIYQGASGISISQDYR